jgi:hypothetical protein
MRCAVLRCHYNDDGYCRQPDYAYIDKNGVCEQMDVKKMTITQKYTELKIIADEAYKTFDFNPTQANSDAYGMALNNLRDFCIEVIDTTVKNRPDITDNIFWEKD